MFHLPGLPVPRFRRTWCDHRCRHDGLPASGDLDPFVNTSRSPDRRGRMAGTGAGCAGSGPVLGPATCNRRNVWQSGRHSSRGGRVFCLRVDVQFRASSRAGGLANPRGWAGFDAIRDDLLHRFTLDYDDTSARGRNRLTGFATAGIDPLSCGCTDGACLYLFLLGDRQMPVNRCGPGPTRQMHCTFGPQPLPLVAGTLSRWRRLGFWVRSLARNGAAWARRTPVPRPRAGWCQGSTGPAGPDSL